MQYRNALSMVRRFAGISLAALSLFGACAVQAEESGNRPLFSFLIPSRTANIEANAPLTAQEIGVAPQLASTIDLTHPTNNLWDRIRNGFAMTNLNDDLVLHYQQWYQNRPDALRRMVERSRPYLYHIVEELEARGMPTELAFLPMVESSFNPAAYSRAHAAGLWQFIPATGKRFNLEQDWWRDQRRDVVASTGAALDYLQNIYDMHGDWHLALASYNWGEGAVKRAIVKNESRGLPTDYPNLNMPNETRHYVPKLQALKNIFGNPVLVAQLGLPPIPNRPYITTMAAPRPMDIKTAARLANISVDEFQRLNPSHNRPIIKPDTPVVIPADKVATFHENLQNHSAPLTEWRAYTLTTSDRLDRIADQFSILASELARVNSLPERARLGAGSVLLVPGTGATDNLAPLLYASAPTQIIEPEPRPCKPAKGKHGARACPRESSRELASTAAPASKSARQEKNKVESKQANAKDRNKQAKAESGKAPAKKASNDTSRSDKGSKTAGSTPASKNSPKVAKSANNRRG